MLKVVVFDGGWGGELVADYLSRELKTIEIVRVIDWDNAPYDDKTLPEIERLSRKNLDNYIGKVDLIVLGGYAVSLALRTLKQKFPEQKFVGMGINYQSILKSRNFPSQVAILVDGIMIESTVCEEIRQNLPYSTIIAPDCSGWEDLINIDEMSQEVLHAELQDYFQVKQLEQIKANRFRKTGRKKVRAAEADLPLIEVLRRRQQEHDKKLKTMAAMEENGAAYGHEPAAGFGAAQERPINQYAYAPEDKILPDVILLLNTHFWEIRPEIEALFGYKTRVLDFRQKLLHDTCLALSLRGVDGKLGK